MQSQIVIGLGYGDEGKGLTTDYLCRQSNNPLVIRFSGGHQAGHTVVNENGDRHVFSSFGAGTMGGYPTYWSQYCTFSPMAFINELATLKKMELQPMIYVDTLAMVTTPFDVMYNHFLEEKNNHGSVGVGFGATIQRNEGPQKLYVKDLKYPQVVKEKLKAIEAYYFKKTNGNLSKDKIKEQVAIFIKILDIIVDTITIVQEKSFFQEIITKGLFEDLVFEGSQGILLDMDFGFFPNVTRCNTTSKNALEIVNRYNLPTPKIYYITRAYQTRHGNGFLSNEDLPLELHENPNETNQYNQWQGHQRKSVLDIDLLNYAIECDKNYSGTSSKNLVITCLDQLTSNLPATISGELKNFDSIKEFSNQLNVKFKTILTSFSDCAAEMKAL